MSFIGELAFEKDFLAGLGFENLGFDEDFLKKGRAQGALRSAIALH